MSKRIALCFDGTWNTPSTHADLNVDPAGGVETNVSRLCRSIRAVAQPVPGVAARAQVKWYDRGVGTNWYDRLPGGAFGLGLSRNIREGYKFLSDTYEDGDEVFIFGFSRGAYTARSLVGMIRNCGLLPRGTSNYTIMEGYQLYRTRDGGPDTMAALEFRGRYRSRMIEIKFLGVWDTVGALGIPIESFGEFNKQQFEFHDTALSAIVKNAYHAVAVDEHRRAYAPTLWDPEQKPDQTVEQRWFLGAHADVGGGYADRRLSDVTLKWMQAKARAVGLELHPAGVPNVDGGNLDAPITDSFGEFLGGLFQVFNQRHYRAIGSAEFGNEVLDHSVITRIQADPAYRPRNPGLERWRVDALLRAGPASPAPSGEALHPAFHNTDDFAAVMNAR